MGHPIDTDELRSEVRAKYIAVAESPDSEFHFHTGRFLADRCGYRRDLVEALPDEAVESFAGVANPFMLRDIGVGEKIVDLGSGAGFDSFLASHATGDSGAVVGVDMTPEMLNKARRTAEELGLDNLEFRKGFAEDVPVETGWADVVISNGVFNLCPSKRRVFEEIRRVLRPGGILQFADIANGRPVPEEALSHIDLWTS
jgi:arsenite methyltransferase